MSSHTFLLLQNMFLKLARPFTETGIASNTNIFVDTSKANRVTALLMAESTKVAGTHCTEKNLLQSGYIRRCRDLPGVVKLYPEPVPFGIYKKENPCTRNSYQKHCYSPGTGVVGLYPLFRAYL